MCDFCARGDPEWEYPCENFTGLTIHGKLGSPVAGATWFSVGEWGACEACRRLVEHEDWDRLVNRILAARGDPRAAGFRAGLAQVIDRFRTHRAGPAVRAGERP